MTTLLEAKATAAGLPSLSKIPAGSRKANVIEVTASTSGPDPIAGMTAEGEEIEVASESAYVIEYETSKLFLKGTDIVPALWREGDGDDVAAKYWKFNPKDKSFKGGPWSITKKALIRIFDNTLAIGAKPAKPTEGAVAVGGLGRG